MAEPSRRQHQRLACSISVGLYAFHSSERLGEARLVDLSLGGGAVETTLALERRLPYELQWWWQRHLVRLPARVVRESPPPAKPGPPRRYGFSFTLTVKQEERLRAFIDALRREGGEAPPDKPSLRDYWSI
jgi:hypothetical protein